MSWYLFNDSRYHTHRRGIYGTCGPLSCSELHNNMVCSVYPKVHFSLRIDERFSTLYRRLELWRDFFLIKSFFLSSKSCMCHMKSKFF